MSLPSLIRNYWAPPDAAAVTDLRSWFKQLSIVLAKFPYVVFLQIQHSDSYFPC